MGSQHRELRLPTCLPQESRDDEWPSHRHSTPRDRGQSMQLKRRGLAIALHLLILTAASAARGIEIDVVAGAQDRLDTPVILTLPGSLAGAQAFSLKRL